MPGRGESAPDTAAGTSARRSLAASTRIHGPSDTSDPHRRGSGDSTVKASVIGAAGAVAAAVAAGLVTYWTAGSSSSDTVQPRISITGWTQHPAAQDAGTAFEFEGTVTDAPPTVSVRVIVKNPRSSQTASSRATDGQAWLVSPPADLLKDGRWKVRWTLTHPPQQARWTAVLVDESMPSATMPPCDGCTPSDRDNLFKYGVDSTDVLDSAVAG
ncbi:hypothetical protein AB0L74_19605 [Streptomyces sp. NPDC052020]|uniref:hypothetical protein n=1 Tax=Streptomyces sp. NPDC052020 TaxID=3155677 RepID=UPI00342CFBB3